MRLAKSLILTAGLTAPQRPSAVGRHCILSNVRMPPAARPIWKPFPHFSLMRLTKKIIEVRHSAMHEAKACMNL